MVKWSRDHKGIRKFTVIVLIIVCLALCVGVWGEYAGIFAGSCSDFEVPSGAGTQRIAADLKDSAVIHSELLFRLAAKIKGVDGQWQTGSFNIAAGSSYGEIFKLLTEPQKGSVKVVIPEGKQVKEIAAIYESAGICDSDEFLAACDKNNYDYDFLKAVTSRNDLEGYLFPDTYYFEPDTQPQVVIEEMLANFAKGMYTDSNISRSESLGYSFDEMLILASMIESEAAKTSDRYSVSGVFHNRLNNPESYPKLQSCVTVEYAMGTKKTILSLADTKYDSPYNTYLYPGLPIGPICCPGNTSLQAALYPESNDYYYFQADEYGNIHYASTFAEHSAIQREVQADWHPDDS